MSLNALYAIIIIALLLFAAFLLLWLSYEWKK